MDFSCTTPTCPSICLCSPFLATEPAWLNRLSSQAPPFSPFPTSYPGRVCRPEGIFWCLALGSSPGNTMDAVGAVAYGDRTLGEVLCYLSLLLPSSFIDLSKCLLGPDYRQKLGMKQRIAGKLSSCPLHYPSSAPRSETLSPSDILSKVAFPRLGSSLACSFPSLISSTTWFSKHHWV